MSSLKKILIGLVAGLTLPLAVSAQATVLQGGTGLTSVPAGSFLAGSTSLRLTATSSPWFPTFTFGSATGTSATTTNLFSTNSTFNNLSLGFTAGSVVYSDGSKLAQDNSGLYWDDVNHRLGINTTSPGYSLTISTTTNSFFNGFQFINSNSGTGAYIRGLFSANNSALNFYQFSSGYSSGNTRYKAAGSTIEGDGTGGLNLSASASTGAINFFTNGNSNRLYISSSGQIGINQTSPATGTKLDVNGNVLIEGNSTTTNATTTSLAVTSLSAGVVTANSAGTLYSVASSSASAASTAVWRDANQNAYAQNFVSASTAFPTNGGTVTLTNASPRTWIFTGTNTETMKLPSGTTLTNGAMYNANNNSTGAITVVDNGNNTLGVVSPGGSAFFQIYDNSTTNGSWDAHARLGHNNVSGTGTLGINTTSPNFNLEVQGTSSTTNLYATNSTTTNATTTTASFTLASTTNQYVSSLGTPAGTFVAADSAGKLIATTTPSGSGMAANTIVPEPNALVASIANSTLSGNTTAQVSQVIIPAKISVNTISWRDNGVTTPGSVRFAIYSEDGQTQYFATTTVAATSGTHTATTTSPVTLNPGIYYLACLPIGSTNVSYTELNVTNISNLYGNIGINGLSEVINGTLTVSADTLPSTFSPSSLTYNNAAAPLVRLTN